MGPPLPAAVTDPLFRGGQDRLSDAPAPPAKAKPSRLTVDIDPGPHTRRKAACALNATDMVTELRQFIESWTAEHSRRL